MGHLAHASAPHAIMAARPHAASTGVVLTAVLCKRKHGTFVRLISVRLRLPLHHCEAEDYA